MKRGEQIGSCVLLTLVSLYVARVECTRYEPNWRSLDSRPLPKWYDESKLGIFLSWGVFSVPSFRSEWFWEYWKGSPKPEVVNFMQRNYKPDFTYAAFARDFTAELYEPGQWAKLFAESGAK